MRLGVIFILVVGVVCSAAVDQKPSRKSSWTGKLLVVPMDGSHWTGVKAVAEEMGRRGHTVIVVIPEISVLLGPGQHYITKMFSVKYDQKSLNKVLNERVLEVTNPGNSFLSTVIRIVSNLRRMFNTMAATSESLFQDKELIESLRNENFDAVLTDPVLPMGAILAYNLSVPAVYLLRGMACGLDATATTCPNPSSYIPRFHTRNTDRMSFGERVMNMLMSILEQTVCKFMYRSFEEMIFNFLQRDVSMTEILRTGAVWLMRYDFTLEFPKPLMPNMQFIGGINCGVRNPLTKEVEEFVNGSGEHGIVVFSLGSLVSSMPKEKADIFFKAFSMIPQRVLWRYTGEIPNNVPENVKLMKWLPQNDLLGHPKARAFITHGGTHGIYEGICHGVPMVMLPLFGDQADNVHRVATRGVGVILSIHDITVETLLDALNSVINNSSYKQKMQKLSAIHNDRPIQPLDLAVFWTEFVMRHKGADHLRPAAHELNWLQYHSLDVIGFMLLIVLIVTLAMLKCCSLCWRRCCRKTQKRKED
ncbi:UDP glucuronosyltransferase 1 family, polypeptide B2 precursor [Danio rerio]|uniref:UDP-glucuronosyltransferase n=1 Tax=Danio rerio TaxID=7955 RepID=D3XD61_DANRE|nr:UDP glucuronosyltransferase 1 family, polypeptide B2 precursor [Danio rerio]ADC91932.1 UDP glucuronosyltransferase 1 family polypeptide b2 isoform 1 [Danio rerio]|eukprot:NP_001170807.1 UDP glucuronosyltransferase 1 family, polypeptide B2 precursor [Danio rerio]